MGLIALAFTYRYLLPFSLAHGRFLCTLRYNSKAVTTTRERLLSCWKQVKLNPNIYTFVVSAKNCTIKHMAWWLSQEWISPARCSCQQSKAGLLWS